MLFGNVELMHEKETAFCGQHVGHLSAVYSQVVRVIQHVPPMFTWPAWFRVSTGNPLISENGTYSVVRL